MSAIDGEQATGEEPQHVEFKYGIQTHLENYRQVEGVTWTERTVAVVVSENTPPYDEDAIIGTLIRSFGFEWEKQIGETTLLFKREDGR